MSSSTPRRIGQIIRLKRESLEAYKECHAAVWPAVLQQIKDCNISDYSIYLDETSMTLFATMKWSGSDFDADMEKMRSNPEVQRWWQLGKCWRSDNHRIPYNEQFLPRCRRGRAYFRRDTRCLTRRAQSDDLVCTLERPPCVGSQLDLPLQHPRCYDADTRFEGCLPVPRCF